VILAAGPMFFAMLAALTANLAQALLVMVACYAALPIGLMLASRIVNFNNGQSMERRSSMALPHRAAAPARRRLRSSCNIRAVPRSRLAFCSCSGLVSLNFQPSCPGAWRSR